MNFHKKNLEILLSKIKSVKTLLILNCNIVTEDKEKLNKAFLPLKKLSAMERLSATAIQENLVGLSGWEHKDNGIEKSFEFKNFTEAFAFMTQVAMIAEKMDHHPDWSNVYNKVSIRLSTHDAGNVVTDRDHALAAKIDELVK